MAEMRKQAGIRPLLVHTGQHYDIGMSDSFFQDLGIPQPDINLEVGSASAACQVAQIMERLEPLLVSDRPDIVVVVGDVNSTLAGALTAVKLGIPVAHVEAGLRSFDRTMPEEINRVVTDSISDFLFASEPSGVENLLKEGRPASHIFLVGNVMIDTLKSSLARARQLDSLADPEIWGENGLNRPARFALRDSSPSFDGRQFASASHRLGGSGGDRQGNSDSFSRPSPHPETTARPRPWLLRNRTAIRSPEWNSIDFSLELPAIPASRKPRHVGHYRLGWHPGRNHSPRCALPYGAGKHGAPHHRNRRNEYACRS